MDNKDYLAYKVGGLLYTPALNTKIADKLISGEYDKLMSLAFCLEDSIADDAVAEAEITLRKSLEKLFRAGTELPLLFVRVRSPHHLEKIHASLGEFSSLLTGYILPKFDISNAEEYSRLIADVNKGRANKLYIMPILESRAVADIERRVGIMQEIKSVLDSVSEFVLNVRVGGNDFSNMYGIRRGVSQNIYEVGVIRDILANIINIFARDYVVSGPVWEYFGENSSGAWARGLRREIELDLLNGFFGKTAIHPAQLPIIFEELSVSPDDYEDAKSITNWSVAGFGVAKGEGGRMNEVKCHQKWAEKILMRAQIYGLKAAETPCSSDLVLQML